MCYGEEGPVVTELYVKPWKTGKELKLPDAVGYVNFFSGAVYDFCFSETDGIKAFNLDEEEVKELVSFSDSDLLINSVNGILPLSDEAVFVMYFEDATQYIGSHPSFGGEGSDNRVLSLFTRVALEGVPECTEITLATAYLTTSLSTRVAQFNPANIENDTDLAGALMGNIQEAYRYQGKKYVIVPSFMAIMVVAKKIHDRRYKHMDSGGRGKNRKRKRHGVGKAVWRKRAA